MKPQRKVLARTSIGPYRLDPAALPQVDKPDTAVGEGTLHDERMGKVQAPGWPACEGDHAYCFGTMGYISLPVDIVNPAFEDIMIQYLRLFRYVAAGDVGVLEMREGIREAINANRTLTGYRRMKAISDSLGTSSSTWQIWKEQAGVTYKVRKETYHIPAIDLKALLTATTAKHSGDDANVRLDEIGLNTEVAKPEDFVIGYIPVMPNGMRIPFFNQPNHPITDMYKGILQAVRANDAGAIREAYLTLIKNGEKANLKDMVFGSKKEGFLRGDMLSKVGGQIARSVATPSIKLEPQEVGVPRRFALDLSQRMEVTLDNMEEIRTLIKEGHITHIMDLRTKKYIRIDKIGQLELRPGKMLVLRQLQDGDVVLVNRQPTLHRNSLLAFTVVLHDDDTIYTHPSVSTGFGLDYDG